jgi:hypothetical protein
MTVKKRKFPLQMIPHLDGENRGNVRPLGNFMSQVGITWSVSNLPVNASLQFPLSQFVDMHTQRPSRNDDRVKAIDGMIGDPSWNAKFDAIDLIGIVSKVNEHHRSVSTEMYCSLIS